MTQGTWLRNSKSWIVFYSVLDLAQALSYKQSNLRWQLYKAGRFRTMEQPVYVSRSEFKVPNVAELVVNVDRKFWADLAIHFSP